MCAQGVPTPIPSKPFRKPTLCNQHIIDTVCARLRAGGYPTVALEAEGLDGANHSEWLTRAQEDYENGLDEATSVYCQYSKAIKAAVAARELSLAALVADAAEAGPQYWAAGMTYLERRHPERWGRRDTTPPAPDVRVQIIHYGGTGSAPLAPMGEVRQLPPPPPEST